MCRYQQYSNMMKGPNYGPLCGHDGVGMFLFLSLIPHQMRKSRENLQVLYSWKIRY